MASALDPSTTFPVLCDACGVDPRLRKAVARLGHVRPTLVQAQCLPLALREGRDLLVRARTGSGKTLAYCLPVLQKLLARRTRPADAVGAVVLVPTRELCHQVAGVARALCHYADDVLSVAALSGAGAGRRGEKLKQELMRQEVLLRDRPSLLVATPAGLLVHLRSGAVDLAHVESLVVDEADLVLSFGYARDVEEIVRALPRIYQGYLMSATLSPELDALKGVVLNKPVTLKLEHDDAVRAGALKQFYMALPGKDKNLLLFVFLKLGLLKGKGLFFVNNTDAGYRLKLFLEQFHIRSAVLNAELPYQSRLNIIEQFNIGSFDYLIATDSSADTVESKTDEDEHDDETEDADPQPKKQSKKRDAEFGVSRGVDFRNVAFVVNVDFPPNPKSYAHRIGRTARGGAKGVALSLVDTDRPAELEALLAVQTAQPRISLAATAAVGQLQPMVSDAVEDAGAAAPPEQAQPMPLDFDLAEVEGFRYRVEDVQRAVTKTAVREARAAELRAEILNSERLQSHFDENPADLQLLQHDRVTTHPARIHEHLKHVPKYLLPKGMQVANLNRKRKRRKSRNSTGGAKRSDNDPLQAFDGDVDLSDIKAEDDDDGEDPYGEFMEDCETPTRDAKKQKATEEKVYTNTKDGTGRSTAGRNAWKEKHKKGAFSNKKRLSEKKYKKPLGV